MFNRNLQIAISFLVILIIFFIVKNNTQVIYPLYGTQSQAKQWQNKIIREAFSRLTTEEMHNPEKAQKAMQSALDTINSYYWIDPAKMNIATCHLITPKLVLRPHKKLCTESTRIPAITHDKGTLQGSHKEHANKP